MQTSEIFTNIRSMIFKDSRISVSKLSKTSSTYEENELFSSHPDVSLIETGFVYFTTKEIKSTKYKVKLPGWMGPKRGSSRVICEGKCWTVSEFSLPDKHNFRVFKVNAVVKVENCSTCPLCQQVIPKTN